MWKYMGDETKLDNIETGELGELETLEKSEVTKARKEKAEELRQVRNATNVKKTWRRTILRDILSDLSPRGHTRVEDGKRTYDSYRGALHFAIDTGEKLLAVALLVVTIIYAGYVGWQLVCTGLDDTSFSFFQQDVRNFTLLLAAFLIFDAAFRIADMIDHPGVEEATGTLVVALAGGILFLLHDVIPDDTSTDSSFELQDAGSIAILVAVLLVLLILRLQLPRLQPKKDRPPGSDEETPG